ncbi:hypothetical protein [Nonomuraea turkmeniaca]|nr:hypothetical protein [Nonomuraea turkmeniaca]
MRGRPQRPKHDLMAIGGSYAPLFRPRAGGYQQQEEEVVLR